METDWPEVAASLAARHKAARLVVLAARARERAQELIVRSTRAQHHRFSAPTLYPDDITTTTRAPVRHSQDVVPGDPGE
jgi:hypothetical protein